MKENKEMCALNDEELENAAGGVSFEKLGTGKNYLAMSNEDSGNDEPPRLLGWKKT